MSIEYIIAGISSSKQFSKAITALEQAVDRVSMAWISDSRRALWAAAIEATGHPVMMITGSMASATEIYQDLKVLCKEVYLFRPLQPVLYSRLAQSIEAEQARIMVLDAVASGRARIVVAPVEALLFPVMPIDNYLKSRYSLKTGQRVDMGELSQRLISTGYVREDMVEGPGQFSIRGGIVDIFSMDGNPYRIELFDDEVDSIRLVDNSTQRSIEKLVGVVIPPAMSLLPDSSDIPVMRRNLETDLARTRDRLKRSKVKQTADQLETEVGEVSRS